MSTSSDLRDFQRVTLPSGERPSHPFSVAVFQRNGSTSWDTSIVVLDGWEAEVMEGDGTISASLPRGLYTIRLERAGARREVVVRHMGPEPTDERLEEPKRTSAMPSFDTVDAHEYYSYTASGLSQQNTSNAPAVFGSPGPGSPRLFIFIRAENKESAVPHNLVDSLFLHDLDGQLLTDFSSDVVERDTSDGWVAFSAPAVAGTYILRHAGLQQREMVLTVHPDWDTQVFVPFQERPLLERASLQLTPKGVPFNPDDSLAQAIDSGLSGLQSGVDLMTREGRQMLLSGKFSAPMLGLVGAHLLLLHEEPSRGLLDIVLGNLDHLLPGSADVQALRLAVALRYGEAIAAVPPMTTPPMLRRGLDAVILASSSLPEIVPEGSFIERIAPYLIADTPWALWSLPTTIAGTAYDDPVVVASRLAGELLDKHLSGSVRARLPGTKTLLSIMKQELPVLLDQMGVGGPDELLKGVHALKSSVVAPELVAARARGAHTLRRTAKSMMLRGVDAALRAKPARTNVGGTDFGVPPWIWHLVVDAVAHSHERGESLDLATLARDARLPLGALERWVGRIAEWRGSIDTLELKEALERFLEGNSDRDLVSKDHGEAQTRNPEPDAEEG